MIGLICQYFFFFLADTSFEFAFTIFDYQWYRLMRLDFWIRHPNVALKSPHTFMANIFSIFLTFNNIPNTARSHANKILSFVVIWFSIMFRCASKPTTINRHISAFFCTDTAYSFSLYLCVYYSALMLTTAIQSLLKI